jgi:glucosamine kinase
LQKLYLGVDAGGTRCRMRLADADLNTLAEVVTDSPSNLQVRAGDSAYESVNELTELVFAKAELPLSNAAGAHACFGMAGGRLTSARESFEKRSFPFANLKVFDDIDIARAGAHKGEEGAVLIIGTGSAGLGIIDGERYQVGGWGFLVGDTMAGAILGRELVRKSLLAHEGLISGSPLTEAVMARFDNDPDKLMAWSFDAPEAHEDDQPGDTKRPAPARPADYGSFVPMFFDYFEKNDPIAIELMSFELEAIDQYVAWYKSRNAQSIAIVGGFGRRLLPILQNRYGELITEAKSDSLTGALILARQLFPGD